MNQLNRSLKKLTPRWLWIALAALSLFSRATAQPAAEPPQRWLFIFDTSAAMKSRQAAVAVELKNLFFTSFSSQLRPGDSIGVWTFNRKINAGGFPLVMWTPSVAAETTSNIVTYLRQQSYTGKTTFAALNPTLSHVIDNSERLTVVLFCDGEDTIKLTPYDDGINQTFNQSKAEREKSNQTFVVVVRTQRGAFVGATVNFPPGTLDLPVFPPLPAAPTVPAVPTNNPPPPTVAAPVQPTVVTPMPPPAVARLPLVIVGTNVGTNINDLPKVVLPAPRVIATNPPPVVIVSNVVVITTTAPATSLTNAPIIKVQTLVTAAPTNAVPATTSSSDSNGDNSTRNLILVGIGLLAAAVVLIFFLVRQRPRAARESLITSSMTNDPKK